MKNLLLCFALLFATMAFSQLNMTTENMYGQELEYNYTDYLNIDITFSSDTALSWIERTTETAGNEKITTTHINEHTTLTGWIDKDKTVISLYSDFSTGKTYGYQYRRNGKIIKLNGSIKLKNPEALPTSKEEVNNPFPIIANKEKTEVIAKNAEVTLAKVDSSSIKISPSLNKETNANSLSKATNESKVFGLYPEASTKLLTLSDIESLNTEALKIMRNEIFARYGHSFNDGGKMDLYFKSQSWYTSKNLDATTLISEIEKQNIALIKTLE